jgi:hypothetical protein
MENKKKVVYLKYLINIRKIIKCEIFPGLNTDIVSNILSYCVFRDTYFHENEIPNHLKNYYFKNKNKNKKSKVCNKRSRMQFIED